ncbi:MAG TPA: molybdopterin cofactor-binding domain-containing protein, partial [Acetobacteraceae bacterium]|nr:molybdopterin cofactor-binding domain-containing protein [Acetobacteraceae bacterium]
VKAIFTNTVPVDAYRGAGRPEATFLLERLVDAVAHDTGIDRVDLRRRNFIPNDAFPYQTPVALQYDSGNYTATLDGALKAADYAGFEARRKTAAGKGKLRGIGVSTYLEACGIAPSAVVGSLGARAGLYEVANIKVHPTGSVTVYTGSHSHGQGHETTFAQLVASQLGVPMDQVDIVHGDTAKIPFGMGTYGSRSLAVGGSAMVKAMDKIITKGKKIAAHLMEASVDDIEFKDNKFTVAGTDKVKTLTDISLAAYVPHNYPIEELEPGLDETSFYDPKNFTFPGGCHVAEIEIDPDTGTISVENFVAVDDVGRVINPMIVEGQVQGGVAQGIGQALLENAVYDSAGQLLSGSMMDYTMPRADNLPNIKVGTEITLCTHNPLGVKGCGEVGAIGSPPAIINAVIDALKEYGVRHINMPASAPKIWGIIEAGRPKMAAE